MTDKKTSKRQMMARVVALAVAEQLEELTGGRWLLVVSCLLLADVALSAVVGMGFAKVFE